MYLAISTSPKNGNHIDLLQHRFHAWDGFEHLLAFTKGSYATSYRARSLYRKSESYIMEVGDHLVSPRVGYTHHGIYIGNEQVIHYSGFSNGISSGEIEIASVDEFSKGNGVCVKEHSIRTFTPDECVSRAFSRLGEDWYNVLLNNCEHFVTWCIVGFHSSSQVNSLISSIAIASTAKNLLIGETHRQTVVTIAHVASATAARSAVSTTAGAVAGIATGASIASGTGATTAIVAGIVATSAAPLVATVAVALGVGYGVKKLAEWIWD